MCQLSLSSRQLGLQACLVLTQRQQLLLALPLLLPQPPRVLRCQAGQRAHAVEGPERALTANDHQALRQARDGVQRAPLRRLSCGGCVQALRRPPPQVRVCQW